MIKISVIGFGNVGGALAKGWVKCGKGHRVILGVRDLNAPELQQFLSDNPDIEAKELREASLEADVIVIAVPVQAVEEVIKACGTMSGKIVIDTTNSVFSRPAGYANGFEAIRKLTESRVIKCFNSTGAENMNNPHYPTETMTTIKADMFVAGNDSEAKKLVSDLAKDIGFEVYDFGGDDKVPLLEQLCMIWINLAMMQGLGRNIAFKLLKR